MFFCTDTDEDSAHDHQEVIDPLPDVVRAQSADPGLLERVVDGSLGNVSTGGAEQQEGDTQPLPTNMHGIKHVKGHHVHTRHLSVITCCL